MRSHPKAGRRAVALGFLSLAIAACGSSSPAASNAVGTPKNGGTLVVALPGDITRTDAALVSDTNSLWVARQVMEGLVGLEAGSLTNVVPVLATQLPTVSSDGLNYTFQIRPGVKFHDGTTLDAAAVKFNYDRWINFPSALQNYSYWANTALGEGSSSNVASVTVDNPMQVTIHLKAPNSSFLIAQTLPSFGIASPAALKQGGADNAVTDVSKMPFAQGGADAMDGTGPFKFSKWVVGSEVDLVRNQSYWDQAAAAHVDRIVFKPIADETATLNSLQSGDVDMAQLVAPTDLKTVQSDPSLQIIDRGPPCNMVQIDMNETFPTVSNPTIRRAIAYAIDRQGILNSIYAGRGVVADSFLPQIMPFYKPLHLPGYDPAKARQLIQQSGLSGPALTLNFYYPSNVSRPYMPDPKGLFQAIASNLQAVGFNVVAQTEVWNPSYNDDEYAGKFPIWILGLSCDYAAPDDFLQLGLFGYINGKPTAEFQYRNDQLNKLMIQAVASTDKNQQSMLWGQVQDMLAQDLPIIPLVNSAPPAVAQTYVKGFKGSGNLVEFLNTVWLNK